MKLPFGLPIPQGSSSKPEWDGKVFVLGEQKVPVLEYNENFSGWSDDLTYLHEEVAGNSHPIDIASRFDAIKQVKRYLPNEGGVVLEIGCSSGFFIQDLIRSFSNAIIIGSDVVREPLYRLARELPGVPLIRFDLLQCPLPEESVDVLIMLNVLEHIRDDVEAIKKSFTLLKPGGTLILEVPAGPSLYDDYDVELHHFRRYSMSELKNKLCRAGFHLSRQTHLGFLLFPAFAAVKLRNKLFPSKEKNMVVRKHARNTSNSGIIRLVMKFESKYFSGLNLPFGIRALIVARKPKDLPS